MYIPSLSLHFIIPFFFFHVFCFISSYIKPSKQCNHECELLQGYIMCLNSEQNASMLALVWIFWQKQRVKNATAQYTPIDGNMTPIQITIRVCYWGASMFPLFWESWQKEIVRNATAQNTPIDRNVLHITARRG